MKRRVRKKARVFRINALTRKVTSIIAMVVVFTTTYMMILPGVAIDRQAAVNSPGMDVAAEPVRILDCHSVPHAHTEACYAEREITDSEGNPTGQTEEILVCGREDYSFMYTRMPAGRMAFLSAHSRNMRSMYMMRTAMK